MSIEPIAALPVDQTAGTAVLKARLSDFLELSKLRLTFLVLVTTAAGFYMGTRGPLNGTLMFHALAGTALVAFGAGALNQYFERDSDGRMVRTQGRPLPSGRMAPLEAVVFGTAVALVGIFYLAVSVNLLTSYLSVVTLTSYIFLYTPLKRVSPLCTWVGAVPGAIPVAMGWTAVRGDFGIEAWVLFAILFFWQLPHFLAIAWIYREDYQRGGFPMLPVVDAKGTITAGQVVLNLVVLLAVSLLPALLGLTGASFYYGATILGLAYLAAGILFAVSRTAQQARRLFLFSVLYLPLLLGWMTLAKSLS